MRINSREPALVFTEDEHTLRIGYSNRGEPFREGVEIELDFQQGTRSDCRYVLLNLDEVRQLRDKLSRFLGET